MKERADAAVKKIDEMLSDPLHLFNQEFDESTAKYLKLQPTNQLQENHGMESELASSAPSARKAAPKDQSLSALKMKSSALGGNQISE